MENIETIIVSSMKTQTLIIAYTDYENDRNFKLKSFDEKINQKIIPRDHIISYICSYIDKKITCKSNQYAISIKKLKNTIMIFFNEMEISKSYYDEDDSSFVFPKIKLTKAQNISIKYFYGDKLVRAMYHIRTSKQNWMLNAHEFICDKDIRLKLYKMIFEAVLLKEYEVKLNCNIYSEVLLDIQTKKDIEEVL